MKIQTLNTHGIGHVVLIMAVVVGAGIIGSYALVASHADALASCVIGGMPKRSNDLPTHPILKITNTGATSFTPSIALDFSVGDGQGHGRGGSTTQTLGAVAPSKTRNFSLSQYSPLTGSWTPSDVSASVTATSTDPSFTCTGTTLKITTPVVTRLAALITDSEKGINALNVTASSVTVPGPISDAQARPIVFTFDGIKYFAYSQGQAPDFNGLPLGLANSMSIVSATVAKPPLVPAHLDKANNLVDPDSQAVGYSTGGN